MVGYAAELLFVVELGVPKGDCKGTKSLMRVTQRDSYIQKNW